MSGKFPPWLRRPWASGDTFAATKTALDELRLHTVCQSARCPNMGECWANGTATVMVLGNACTRNCGFCSVPSAKSGWADPDEPAHVAEAVRRMGLRHAVITTVVRDDLPDGGAAHIAATVRAVRQRNPDTTIEVLVSDFAGDDAALETVLETRPEVFGHNIETVERLHAKVRDRRFSYEDSLETLRYARAYDPRSIVKTAIMVGHGETEDEVRATLGDLRQAGVDAVCIGQYLQPSTRQLEVTQYVPPEVFTAYEDLAYALGFEYAVAGPFVRSSYRSEAVLEAPFARARLADAALA